MFKSSKGLLSALAITALLMISAVATCAQTTGSVTMNATVSNRRSSNADRQFRWQHHYGRYRKLAIGSGCKPGRIGPKQH
jgi:hypothetical protein